MTIFDVNVLIYAMRHDAPHHEISRNSLQEMLNGGDTVGWHPGIAAGLIRVATNSKLYEEPSSLEQCLAFLNTLRSSAATIQVAEGPGFWEEFENILKTSGMRGKRVSDAYWATLAIHNGATFVTADRGFSAFPGLKWKNLLDLPDVEAS
jgi:toxin-antitoxin system PIN domain toxin